MESAYSLKIDAYSHISPPKYTETLKKEHPGFYNAILGTCPPLFDMEERFRIMDMYPGIVQVLTVGPVPSLEDFADPEKSVGLAKMANDEMAELVFKYRDRFIAAIALLPMNNIDAAIKEADRAINELGFRGIYVHSNINGKPLDSPEFLPLFEKMSKCNLPIYIHPWRSDNVAEYPSEKSTKYMIASLFGWPYETAAAMTRLVFSGVFEKFPNLKFIVHHAGGMVPFLEERIIGAYDHAEMHRRAKFKNGLTQAPIDYFKKSFYYDTAIYGNYAALMCTRTFCSADQMLFGTDFPYDSQFGERYTRQTIEAIEAMDIDTSERQQIFITNARKLLRLPI